MTARIDFFPGQASMAEEGKVLFCLFGIGSGVKEELVLVLALEQEETF